MSKLNGPEFILPNFFIAGAAKSGTTSLHDYLRQNPDIFMSEIKEPHFFAWERECRRGVLAYAQNFSKANGFKARGESSTGYMVFPHVIERIQALVPDSRFIFLLRNPVERAYSHYWWLKGLGLEDRPFRVAFLSDMDQEPDPNNDHYGNYKYYYQYGCYGKWIRRFVDVFGLERVLVVTTEQLKSDPLMVVNKCCDFLGVGRLGSIASVESNKTGIVRFGKYYWHVRQLILSPHLDRLFGSVSFPNMHRKLWSLRSGIERAREGILFHPKSYPKADPAERSWLADFYQRDVDLLRGIVKQEFLEWANNFRRPDDMDIRS